MRTFFILALSALSSVIAAPAVSDELVIQDGGVHTKEGWSFVDCGLPTDLVTIKSLTVSPDPPQPGKNLTVTVSGTVHQTIEDGAYADVVVKLGLIKLLQKTFDVCEEAANNDLEIQCPVKEGDYTIVKEVELPKEIPRAKFLVSVRGYSVEDEPLVCADIHVDFMRRFPHFG